LKKKKKKKRKGPRLGKHPVVRGVVMNPVDHPHGVVKGGPQLVEKNPQPLGVILHLEGEVEK
jgi:ribosomal protein L2